MKSNPTTRIKLDYNRIDKLEFRIIFQRKINSYPVPNLMVPTGRNEYGVSRALEKCERFCLG